MFTFPQITEPGLIQFCESCPLLEELTLSGSINFNELLFNTIIEKLPRLQVLNIEQRKPIHKIAPNTCQLKIEYNDGRPTYCYKFP